MISLREFAIKLGLDVDKASFAKGAIALSVVQVGINKLAELASDGFARFKETLEAGSKIKNTAQQIGIATDALQELQYAGNLVDLSAESMSMSIGLLSRKMQQAKDGSEETAKAFKGIKFQEGGKLRNADEVLGDIADKFQKMPDGAEKTAAAMQLFGRAGKQMIPLLNKGRDGLEAMKQEAHEMGLVLDKEAIEQSHELTQNLTRLEAVTTGLWRQAIGPLIPVISGLVKEFLEWRKVNAKLISQKFHEYIKYVVASIDFMVGSAKGAYIVLGTVRDVFMEIWNAGTLAKAAVVLLGTALAVAFAPITAIVAGLGALMLIVEDLDVYARGGDSVFGNFKKQLDDWLKPSDEDTWFVAAIKYFLSLIKEAMGQIDEMKEKLTIGGFLRNFTIPGIAGKIAGAVAGKAVTNVADIGYSIANPTAASSFGGAFHDFGGAGTTNNSSARVQAPVTINVQRGVGESDDGLVDKIKESVSGFFDGILQSTPAGTVP